MASQTYRFVKKNLMIVFLVFVFLLLDRFKRMKLLKIVRNLPIICVVMKNFRFSIAILASLLFSMNAGRYLFQKIRDKKSGPTKLAPINMRLMTSIEACNFD